MGEQCLISRSAATYFRVSLARDDMKGPEIYQQEIERYCTYGLTNVRTDGKKLLVAQKLESPRGNGQKWDVHTLEFHNGEFAYVRDN